jgi:hypothetical protein
LLQYVSPIQYSLGYGRCVVPPPGIDRGVNMRRIIGMALIMAATVAIALASSSSGGAPEIDPGSATSALALLAGAALMIRGRRRS